MPGGMALAEDILREAAAATASRMLKQYPPPATADAFEAIQSHSALLAESGIVPAGGVEVTRGPSGRVRVSVKPEHCLFAAHCEALMTEALECPCPKRLYMERMAAAATGKSMGSVVIECARRGVFV